MVGTEEARRIDEEIRVRQSLIGSYPSEIQQRISQLGLMPGNVEIQIRKLNGLFVDVRQK